MEKCPKCGSEAYLSEEEFAGNVESSDPPKVAVKQIFKCKACGERFSRLVFQDLDSKKAGKAEKPKPAPAKPEDPFSGFHKPMPGMDDPERIEFF